MSHIGGAYSNITVVQRVTPALRVARHRAGETAPPHASEINSSSHQTEINGWPGLGGQKPRRAMIAYLDDVLGNVENK